MENEKEKLTKGLRELSEIGRDQRVDDGTNLTDTDLSLLCLVAEMSKETKKKFLESLKLIKAGTPIKEAMDSTGFSEAYKKERG